MGISIDVKPPTESVRKSQNHRIQITLKRSRGSWSLQESILIQSSRPGGVGKVKIAAFISSTSEDRYTNNVPRDIVEVKHR